MAAPNCPGAEVPRHVCLLVISRSQEKYSSVQLPTKPVFFKQMCIFPAVFSQLCWEVGRETELLPSLPRQEQGKHEGKYEEIRQVAFFIYLHTDCFSRSVKSPGSGVAMSPVLVGEGGFVNKKPQQINPSQFVSKLSVILETPIKLNRNRTWK